MYEFKYILALVSITAFYNIETEDFSSFYLFKTSQNKEEVQLPTHIFIRKEGSKWIFDYEDGFLNNEYKESILEYLEGLIREVMF